MNQKETCAYFESTLKKQCGVKKDYNCRGQILLCPEPREFVYRSDILVEKNNAADTEIIPRNQTSNQ